MAIEVADCARRDVFSEKQFVVASHPGLELDGVFYGAIFVLHSIRCRTVWDALCVGELSEIAITFIASR